MSEEYQDEGISEFQDTNRFFQRVDEAGTGCEECWMELHGPEGYSKVFKFITLVDMYFRIFKYVSKDDGDKTRMENKRKKLMEQAQKETRRINANKLYCPFGEPSLSPPLMESLRDYLDEAYKLRHKYKLASRTLKKIDSAKRARNAVRY